MEKQKITGSEALLKALIAEGVDIIPADRRYLFTTVYMIIGTS
jgi:hypothetical protein